MKKTLLCVAGAFIALAMFTGCNTNKQNTSESASQVVIAPAPIEDGVYEAEFHTDNSMFHVNEAYDGKGILTVKDGAMMMHVTMPSKNVLNLYEGLAEDAGKKGAVLLEPTLDTVTYSDGTSEEVYGFDFRVPYLEDEFDLALIGKKEVWYDHKVYVCNPVLKGADEAETSEETSEIASEVAQEAGEYTIEVELEGGSGKAGITSPATIKVTDDGMILIIEWSSPNYDYMIVKDVKYLPTNKEGNSIFEIPIETVDESLDVIADTVAMSKPHEIEYTIHFKSETMKPIS